jgi:diaminopimelate decarboxylase
MITGQNKKPLRPEDWGLAIDRLDELTIGHCSCTELAAIYSTPLHVVDEEGLYQRAKKFLDGFTDTYPGQVSVHYAFKCNPVPGVIRIIRNAGLKAEVMSEFELYLATRIGFTPNEIVVNGPYKPDCFLQSCVDAGVRFVIIDSLDEMRRLDLISKHAGKERVGILLRINPDYTPKGMNRGSATGSRKGCSLGLDLKSGEVLNALDMLKETGSLDFQGFHFHIGTGIRYPEEYRKAISTLRGLIGETRKRNLDVKVLDIGGGYATPFSREMTTGEMLLYQALDHLSSMNPEYGIHDYDRFAKAVTDGVRNIFREGPLPELVAEPGRCITSPSQILLLTVHQVKERKGLRKNLITDGGIGTVTMPTFYEHHEVFLCNDPERPRSEYVNINGPGCFASDMVYRNKFMPEIKPGEILAVMDSGAYFTSWESNFGFPRPAIAAVKDGQYRLLRSRESFENMIGRDLID